MKIGWLLTSGKNKIKTDTVLKNFWRDNARFADLFNAVLFNGDNVIKPEALEEADTDLSAILKIGSHTETLQKILDVVKKSAYGVDFVILRLENQQHIHFGMPLRLMVGDALGYLKEYEEITKKNKEEGHWDDHRIERAYQPCFGKKRRQDEYVYGIGRIKKRRHTGRKN